MTSATWVDLGMDNYLKDFDRVNGIYEDTVDSLEKSMNGLGESLYGRTNNQSTCDASSTITTCADLLNRQVAAFEGYMSNNEAILAGT